MEYLPRLRLEQEPRHSTERRGSCYTKGMEENSALVIWFVPVVGVLAGVAALAGVVLALSTLFLLMMG